MAKGRILYVHGAGNRAQDAARSAGLLRTRLHLEAAPDRLVVSDWGQALGPDAGLPGLDRVLPVYPDHGLRVAGIAPGRDAVLTDAYAPLRALGPAPRRAPRTTRRAAAADATAAAAAGAPRTTSRRSARAGKAAGRRSEDADRLLAFLALGGVDLSAGGVPAGKLAAAARDVASSPEYAAAKGGAPAILDATATSVLARAAELDPASAGRKGLLGIDLGWLADRAGDLAAAVLGGGLASAVEAWVGPHLTPGLSLWASRKVAPKRRALMHDHTLVAADVLHYERNGERIRSHVRAEIAALATPRMVLAHSLGGIIAVDALFGPGAPALDVALLVTFGSQSPFLAAIDALDTVTPRVPWLNLWATYDFVSFLAAGTWPGSVEDREIPAEVGFPAAHGSYFTSEEFGRAILSHPAAAGVLA
jgi:hypothetical protein